MTENKYRRAREDKLRSGNCAVFGSVQYARDLGFDPHPDFAAAAGHLGSRTGTSTISFGKDGRPFYIFGPYDDPGSVIRTLECTVGRGNFDVLAIGG